MALSRFFAQIRSIHSSQKTRNKFGAVPVTPNEFDFECEDSIHGRVNARLEERDLMNFVLRAQNINAGTNGQ